MSDQRAREEYLELLKTKEDLIKRLAKFPINSRQKFTENQKSENKKEIIELIYTYNETKDATQVIIGHLANYTEETCLHYHKVLNLPLDSWTTRVNEALRFEDSLV